MRAPSFWRNREVLSTLLLPLALGYDLVGWLRWRLARPARVGIPVICVGNLTAGGAGKTPSVLALAALLKERGVAVQAVTRGYGGRETGPLRVDPARHDAAAVGDEPLLLARACPTWVARDRVAGARAAEAEGAQALLLDDGLQNPFLYKDFRLAVVDAVSGFGNGRVIPAGPLRENLSRGLRRADALLVIGEAEEGMLATFGKPVLRAALVPSGAEGWYGRRLLAFAGIGRPGKFFETLTAAGVELAGTRVFADHHPYSAAEANALLAEARRLGAALVTTEKDFVRLPPMLAAATQVLPVALRWRDKQQIEDLLEQILPDVQAQS